MMLPDFEANNRGTLSLSKLNARSPANNNSQRFSLNGLWNLPIPGQIELVPIVTLGTGRPIDPLVGLDANLGDAFPLAARPLGFGGNSLQTPRTATDSGFWASSALMVLGGKPLSIFRF